MPDPIIKGTSDVWEKAPEYSYDPRRGTIVRRFMFQAGGWDLLLIKEQEAIAAGYSTNLVKSPHLSQLTITSPEIPTGGGGSGDPAPEIITDTWQLIGNNVPRIRSQNYYLRDQLATFFGGYTNNALRIIYKAASDGTDTKTAAAALSAEDSTTYGVPTGAMVKALVSQLRRGENDFTTFEYTLRHTTNVADNTLYNVAESNVGLLHTTAQLLSEITDAGLWVKPAPVRIQAAISAIPNEDLDASDPDYSYYAWRWLKSASQQTTNADNRVDIVTDYQLKLWSTLDYDTV